MNKFEIMQNIHLCIRFVTETISKITKVLYILLYIYFFYWKDCTLEMRGENKENKELYNDMIILNYIFISFRPGYVSFSVSNTDLGSQRL